MSIISEHEQSFLFTSHCCSSEWNVYSRPCPFFPSNFGLWPSRVYFVVIQLLSPVLLFATPWTAACQASLSFTISWSLLKLLSSDAIQLSHPLLSPSPPAVNHSQPQGLFQRVGSSHQVAKILELQLSALPVNIRLIPCRIDWFDLLTKGLLRLLQHHNSKASKPILYSYPYKSPNSRIPPLGINGFGEAG